MTDAYHQALAAMDAGDADALRRVLVANPTVVHESDDTHAGIYSGYFMHARLLHHVAGNPIRGALPPNIVELGRILIDAGADVKAPCGDQKEGDVLGLVASSAPMAESGLYRPMIDLLLQRGVSLADDRGVLSVCLYHTVECQKQRAVGEYLADKGAKIDLVFAAALGRTDLVDSFFDDRGALTANAHGPFRTDAETRRASTDAALKQEALTWAAMNGRDAAVRQLMKRGADVNGFAEVARTPITPSHGAAWAGWVSTCALLLDLGADHTLTDPRWNNTPLGLAAWCRQQEVIDFYKRALAGSLPLVDLIAVGDLPEVEAAMEGIDPNAVPPGTKANPGVLLRNAAVYGRADTVRLLLARGADPSLRNPEGNTARELAAGRGFSEVVALLNR